MYSKMCYVACSLQSMQKNACVNINVIRQSAASARLNLPVRSIILLDLSVMSVCWHILMRIDMFLVGVPCEIK